jgi:hypothetical protein
MPTPVLYPTKTRLRLLRHVAAGLVKESPYGRHESYDGGESLRKVTGRVDELSRAGLVTLKPADRPTGSTFAPWRVWDVTDAGRAVLDTHPEDH